MVRLARAEDAAELTAFFTRSGSRCYCQYWQFPGDHRAWQVVCAQTPEQNAARLELDLHEGRLTALVSEADGGIDGWVRVEREAGLEKLYQGRLYKGLPCFSVPRQRGAAIACLLVRPDVRRQGVASRLIGAAVEFCRSRGDAYVEAFPRGQEDVSDEEHWMGPQAAYMGWGFRIVHDFPPYPVLRLEL